MKKLLAVFNGTKVEFESLEENNFLEDFMADAAHYRNHYEKHN